MTVNIAKPLVRSSVGVDTSAVWDNDNNKGVGYVDFGESPIMPVYSIRVYSIT